MLIQNACTQMVNKMFIKAGTLLPKRATELYFAPEQNNECNIFRKKLIFKLL